MVEELSYRNGLDIAIDNLPEKSLLEMLGFIYKKCDSAEHQKILFILFDMILNRLNKISPVGQSTKVDNMLAYYDENGHKDFTHKDSGAPVLKAQHP